VALIGKQKAAMLLMSLDAATATELLKGLQMEEVQEIAMQIAQLDASGQLDTKEQAKIAQDFYISLTKSQSQKFSVKGFFNEMLVKILGKDKAEQIQSHIRKVTEKQDPFVAIRSASTDELVLALEGEHPQTVGVVLSELAPQKSQEVLSLLSEDIRLKAVCKMTNQELLGTGVRERMASMVSKRLKTFKGETLLDRPERREQELRKLALVLSGLEKNLRDQLLDEIKKILRQ